MRLDKAVSKPLSLRRCRVPVAKMISPMDVRDFTDAVEVIDAHVHVQRSEAHGREMYEYCLMRGPGMSGPAKAPALGTLEQVLRLRDRTGVRHINILAFTWSGCYYRDGQFTLADDPAGRAEGERELCARITRRIRDNNAWVRKTVGSHQGFSFFCGVDPVVMDEMTMLEEVEDQIGRGAKGVKLVPHDLGIRGDDRRLWPLYAYVQGRDIPLYAQVGGYPGTTSRPAYFSEALAAFPRLRVIFSHMGHGPEFGRGSDAEFAELARQYDGVRGDLSLRLPEVADGHVSPDQMVAHIRKIGAQRLLYGSNFCLNEMLHPDRSAPDTTAFQITQTWKGLQVLATLPLTDEERADIAGRNFRHFVGLDAATSAP